MGKHPQITCRADYVYPGAVDRHSANAESVGTNWTVKPETAGRVRQRIESILDFAKVRGYRAVENPARWRGHLDKLLPTRAKVRATVHHAALPYAELPAFLASLRAREAVAPVHWSS